MIRIITRCLSKSTFSQRKIAGLFAFMVFRSFKNKFVNGKKLNWWYRFKKGDVVEIIERPQGVIEMFGLGTILTAIFVAHPIITSAIVLGAVGALAAAGTALMSRGRSSIGTTSKEYDSKTQPELTGSNNSISDGIIPYLFGKTQQTPNYGQLAYRLVSDGASTNKLRQYFIANYNNVVYSEEKLGTTPLSNYSIDYVSTSKSFGGSSFIGFDNVKSVNVDEELSYDPDGQVNESATYTYNQNTISSSIKVDFELLFSNVDFANWGDKTFQLKATVLDGSSNTVELTQSFTITSGSLVDEGDNNYSYSGTKTWTQTITRLVSTQFSPTADTRTNSYENTSGLNSLYVSEKIITADFNTETVLNQSINRYLGTTSEVIQTSPPKTVEIDVIIAFKQGLFTQESDGSRSSRTANVSIEYKTETGTYQPISDANALYIRDINGTKQALSISTTTVDGAVCTFHSPSNLDVSDQLFYRPIGFEVDEGIYSVRIRSADFADKTNFDIGSPYCSEVQFYVNDDILDESILPNVNQIAFEAIAYKGLSGQLQKYNYIAESEIPIWDGNDWNTIEKTTNPAAIIRDLLTNKLVNPRAQSIDYIDNDSLVELYEWCEYSGYKASGIVSDETKISDIVENILSNCQAAIIPMLNGKHTFVIDKPNKTPVGLFNQHNSFDFKWSPIVGRQTEAIRGSFINNDGYREDEMTLYYYAGDVHETPESGKTGSDYEIMKKDYKYVNDYDSVKNIIEYELKMIQEKRNRFEFSVNLEALNMQLLDRCYISNSVNMQNESTGLIKEVLISGANIIGFKLYSFVDIPENANIIIRSLDYDNETSVINVYEVTNSGNTDTVNISAIPNTGVIKGACQITGLKDSWHYDGDLFIIGQDTIYDVLITDIKYNEDNTATITAREY